MRRRPIYSALCVLCVLALESAPVSADPVSIAALSGASSAQHPTGRFEVFVADTGANGGVYHTWQLSDQAGWQPIWQKYAPAPDSDLDNPENALVAGRDRFGRIVVAWISNREIHFAESLHPDASLSNDASLTVKRIIDPFDHKNYGFKSLKIATYPNGSIEIFALSENGRVWSIREGVPADEGKPWIGQMHDGSGRPISSNLQLIGGGDLKSMSVTSVGDHLVMSGTGKNGVAYLKNQSVPEAWDGDPWTNIGGHDIQTTLVQESAAHQVEAIALGGDGHLYLNYQSVGANGLTGFVGWSRLLPSQSSLKFGPTVVFDKYSDGRLFAAAHNGTYGYGTFYRTIQNPNNGGWPDSYVGYHAVTFHPAGVTNPDYLSFLSPKVFTYARDAQGAINYFVAYDSARKIEHYIESASSISNGSLGYENGQEHAIPDLP